MSTGDHWISSINVRIVGGMSGTVGPGELTNGAFGKSPGVTDQETDLSLQICRD